MVVLHTTRLELGPLAMSIVMHRHYRKTVLAGMPTLNYLDDCPAFPKDRRLAIAFMQGGIDAERRYLRHRLPGFVPAV